MITKVPSDEEILAKLESGFVGLDQQRADGLVRISDFQATQTKMLEREQARLEKKYTADHPRVRKIAERLSFNQGLRQELDREIEKSKIVVPEIDVNTWMVHGRVMDADGVAVSGLAVSLYDDVEQVVSQFRHSCTDELGHFVLQYKVAENDRSPISASQKLFLTVTDANHNRLYQATDPLYVRFGTIDYRLIVIKEPIQSCTPPEIEDIATYPGAWVACGKVFDEDKKPYQGLMVTLYDKDFIFDDVLGSVVTDENGVFKIIYPTEAFRNLFEEKPDLYLKISDSNGKLIYSSEDFVRPNADHMERFRIMIKRNRTARRKRSG